MVYEKRVKLLLRPITKYTFATLAGVSFFHLVWLLNGRSFAYDLARFIGFQIGVSTSVFLWYILGAIVGIELINIVLVNHTAGILEKDELDMYLEPEIRRDETLILIPALNEQESILEAITVASEVGRVLIIDDGSSDKTQARALKRADFVISHRHNLGLASAVQHGVEFGLSKKFKQFVIFDADGQYTAKDLKVITQALQNSSYDMIMGSRLEGWIENMKFSKRLGNYVFSKVLTYITRIPISDGQTGLRAFTDKFAASINLRGTFTYTQEMLFEAAQNNFSIAEIPIRFLKREHGESRLMGGPVNYALRAWALNLQILAEYNPLKFAAIQTGLLLTISFIALAENAGGVNTTIIIILCLFMLMLEVGIFSSIMIRKLSSLNPKKRYTVLKSS